MKRIVVGVDGSESSRHALRWALEEARYRQLPMTVVMAWQDPVFTTIPVYGIEPPDEDLQREYEARLLGILQDEGLTEVSDVEVLTRVVGGPSAPTLLAAVGSDDLLVVGNRGRGAFGGMLLGSVSLHCVTHAPCPVTVVRDGSEARP